MRRGARTFWITAAVCVLAACDQGADPPEAPPEGDVTPAEADAPPPKTSIMRPSVLAEVQPEPPPPPDPVERRIMFDVASADLSENARAKLDDLLQTDGMAAGDWAISLTGRADPSGNAQANLRLSRQRAQAVRDHLLEGGVPAERVRITAAGAAEGQPVAEADMAEARRVDVRAEPAASRDEAAD